MATFWFIEVSHNIVRHKDFRVIINECMITHIKEEHEYQLWMHNYTYYAENAYRTTSRENWNVKTNNVWKVEIGRNTE